ncbi:MAG: methyltransferase domain-containing protein [Candidatus Falkowbacteria bacterium]|nr:MAG: methyltransferase domain-containing protein [Candidatus Falkowbacteria bacterium]
MELSRSLLTAKKIAAVIVDLGQTLLKGAINDDQFVLDPERLEAIKFLYARGIQIFIISKNDRDVVLRALESLGIDKNLFTYIMANLEPKVKNIAQLLEATQISQSAAIFIDSNPAKRKAAQENFPRLHVLEPEQIIFLSAIPVVDIRSVELLSSIKHRQNRYRAKLDKWFLSWGKSASLELQKALRQEICLASPSVNDLYRLARLFFTTQKLNFNPFVFNDERELLEIIFQKVNSGSVIYAISASQQGNSFGLIGSFIVSVNGDEATIENATFSSSAMGFNFEERALAILLGKLRKQGVSKVFLQLVNSTANSSIQHLLWRMGFHFISTDLNGHLLFDKYINRFDAEKHLPAIKESDKLDLDCPGIPEVISFFYQEVAPLIKEGDVIVNLGSAQGEVLGLLEEKQKEDFKSLISMAKFSNLDLEAVPGMDNLVADAENLQTIFSDESQNQVWAVELLEHTKHPWRVINEMARICQVDGYIFITVPGKSFPKHEAPVDFWRIGPKTLVKLFPRDYFKVIALENAGSPDNLRRTMLVLQKTKPTPVTLTSAFIGGDFNEENGITYFD